jgi:hypothetical protein
MTVSTETSTLLSELRDAAESAQRAEGEEFDLEDLDDLRYVVRELWDGDNVWAVVGALLRYPDYLVGSTDLRDVLDMAGRWVGAVGASEALDWLSVGAWSPSTAVELHALGVTPEDLASDRANNRWGPLGGFYGDEERTIVDEVCNGYLTAQQVRDMLDIVLGRATAEDAYRIVRGSR